MRVVIRLLLLMVLFLSVYVIGYRVVYDFHLIWQGDTFVVKKSSPEGYDYLLHIPRGYNDFSGPQPLLIFLHGAGERGTDPQTLKNHGPAYHATNIFKNRETSYFPFIIVSPICPEDHWEPHRVIALLDQVLVENRFRFRIDPDRVFLTGYSMGGFGAFKTAMVYPERFAAVVPVAGGGEPNKAEKLSDVATWVFHGADDMIVPVLSSALVVERMQELGHKDVTMTLLPLVEHGIADDVYGNDSLYRWLLLKRKSRFGQEETFDRGLQPLQPTTEVAEEVAPDLLDDTGVPNDDDLPEENLADSDAIEESEELEPDSFDNDLDNDVESETDALDDRGLAEENPDPVVAAEPQPTMKETQSDLLDDGAGSDTSDLINRGLPEENLADPIVTEEPHSE